jgi:calcineurin-like phosphoesterase family protein
MIITLDKAEGIFFTSDHHFGHHNIIHHAKRPFATTDEMNEAMIHHWNERVKPQDTVFHLGDLTLNAEARPYLEQLNGTIHLVALEWHHDKAWLKKQKNKPPLFSKSGLEVKLLPALILLKVNAFKIDRFALPITLSHYPLAEWEASHYGGWQLHGHSHGNYRDPKSRACVDVGVDRQGFYPVSLLELRERLPQEGKLNL